MFLDAFDMAILYVSARERIHHCASTEQHKFQNHKKSHIGTYITAPAHSFYSNQTQEMAKSVDSDDADAHEDSILEAIGYKQELKRGFSTLMSVSFCFTAVAVLSSTSMLFSFGLQTGGPAAIIFGWVVTSVFSILTGLALAELCSTLPCAGTESSCMRSNKTILF